MKERGRMYKYKYCFIFASTIPFGHAAVFICYNHNDNSITYIFVCSHSTTIEYVFLRLRSGIRVFVLSILNGKIKTVGKCTHKWGGFSHVRKPIKAAFTANKAAVNETDTYNNTNKAGVDGTYAHSPWGGWGSLLLITVGILLIYGFYSYLYEYFHTIYFCSDLMLTEEEARNFKHVAILRVNSVLFRCLHYKQRGRLMLRALEYVGIHDSVPEAGVGKPLPPGAEKILNEFVAHITKHKHVRGPDLMVRLSYLCLEALANLCINADVKHTLRHHAKLLREAHALFRKLRRK